MTLKDAMLNYYDKWIAIKRDGSEKSIHSVTEKITVTDAIAEDWVPDVKFVSSSDIYDRNVNFISDYESHVKYCYIFNGKSRKEAWIKILDGKLIGILSRNEMACETNAHMLFEISGEKTRELEVWVALIKSLF